MSSIAKKQRLSNILKKIGPPDIYKNSDELERFNHEDLLYMTDLELWKEQKRAELALAVWDPDEAVTVGLDFEVITAESWLLERLAAIRKYQLEVVS